MKKSKKEQYELLMKRITELESWAEAARKSKDLESEDDWEWIMLNEVAGEAEEIIKLVQEMTSNDE